MGVPQGLRPYIVPRIPSRDKPLTQPEVLKVMRDTNLRYVKNVTVGQLSIPDLGTIPGVEDSGGYMMNRDEVLDLEQWGKDILRSRNLSIAIQMGCIVPVPSPEEAGQFPSARPDSTYYTPGVSHPQLALDSEYDVKLADVQKKEDDYNKRLQGKMTGSRLAQRSRETAASGEATPVPVVPGDPETGIPSASSMPQSVKRPEELQQQVPSSVPAVQPPVASPEGPEAQPLAPGDFEVADRPVQQREPGDDAADEGRNFFASGDFEAAVSMFETALEKGVSVKGSITALLDVAKGKLKDKSKAKKVAPKKKAASKKKVAPKKVVDKKVAASSGGKQE